MINPLFNSKLIVILLLNLIISVPLLAQKNDETITTSTEKAKKKENRFQYFDINQYEQKFLLKITTPSNGAGYIRFFDTPNVYEGTELMIETKLRPFLSVDSRVRLVAASDDTGFTNFESGIRFYYSKLKNLKSKSDTINNFNGNYFRLGYEKDFNYSGILLKGDDISLSFGRQYILAKNHVIDASLSLIYNDYFNEFSLITGIRIGTAFGKTKLPKDYNPLSQSEKIIQPIWGKSIFAITDPIISLSSDNTRRTLLSISFTGEFNINNYFTIKSKLSVGSIRLNSFNRFNESSIGTLLSMEARKYIGIKKALEQGYQVKSFTGGFIGLELDNLLTLGSAKERLESGILSIDTEILPFIKFGAQDRIGKKLIYELSIGYGHSFNRSVGILKLNTSLGYLIRKKKQS